MSRLRIFDDADPATPLSSTTDRDAIAAGLATIGVTFEQWTPSCEVTPGDPPEKVMAAYRDDIDRLVAARGFKSVDVVSIAPDNPNRDATVCVRECVCSTQPISGKRAYSCVCSSVSADGRWSVATGRPSKSTTMMSSRVSRPLSRPETVIAAWRSSSRREKLLLVAGVQPSAASSRVWATISSARVASRAGS